MKRTRRSTLWIAPILISFASLCAGTPQSVPAEQKASAAKTDPFVTGPPLTLDQVRRLLHEDAIPMRRRKEAIQNRGVSFSLSPQTLEALKAAGATGEILDLIEIKAPPGAVAAITVAPPRELHGGLAIKCQPAECDVSLNGIPRGSSDGGVMELAGLTPGRWVVDVTKDGYIGRQSLVNIEADKTASIAAVLDPTHPTQEALGAELLQKVVDALGGETGLGELAFVQAAGSTTIAREGASVRWTVLMRNRPDRALFQARAGSVLHEVVFQGNEFMASKNLKGQDAMELPTDFGYIRDNQLPALITRLQNSRYKLTAPHTPPVAAEEFDLLAESNTEKIAIKLDSALRPEKVRITSDSGAGSVTIIYDDYTQSGHTSFPKTMQIKPDGRARGIDVRFDNVELDSNLKDTEYKIRGKALPMLLN